MKKSKKLLVVLMVVIMLFDTFNMTVNAQVMYNTLGSTRALSGTWIKDSATGKWWYKHEDGSYTQNNWEYINGNWYWFDEFGWMQTGWKQIDGRWYWFGSDDSGYMRKGWQKIDGKYYWFDTDGGMITGRRRISGIDYYFDSSGVLTYDASLVAAIYTKDYGSFDINTLPDGDRVVSIINDRYFTEEYDNFTKSSFVLSNNLVKTNNLNKGIFFYSGHGFSNGEGISIGDGTGISPAELSRLSMNNTKVAFFFACYCGVVDASSGESMASAAIKAGAKASYAYKVASNVVGDRSVAGLIFSEMMNGATLDNAVYSARLRHPDYAPLKSSNLVLKGNTSIKINDTYQLRSYEKLEIPNGYSLKERQGEQELYVLEFHGYETTDKFIYDSNNSKYVYKRDKIDIDRLEEINFELVENNSKEFEVVHNNKEYFEYYDYVTMVEDNPTVVRVCAYIENATLEYDCFDMQSNTYINNSVDLFEDIL